MARPSSKSPRRTSASLPLPFDHTATPRLQDFARNPPATTTKKRGARTLLSAKPSQPPPLSAKPSVRQSHRSRMFLQQAQQPKNQPQSGVRTQPTPQAVGRTEKTTQLRKMESSPSVKRKKTNQKESKPQSQPPRAETGATSAPSSNSPAYGPKQRCRS